jgi:hypothetical protein
MLSDQIRQLAQDYAAAQQAHEQDPNSSELEARAAQAYDQFVAQLEVEEIRYYDDEDAARIAAGIVDKTFDVRYHKCGRALIRDGEMLRIHGGRLAGRVVDRCPGCQKSLNAFTLYANPGGVARDLLRDAGLYPTADGLVLVGDPERRADILQELQGSLGELGDGDLLAVYAVVVALIEDSAAS